MPLQPLNYFFNLLQRFVFKQVYPPATAPAPNATAVQELKLIIKAIIAPIILIFLICLTSQSGFLFKLT